MSDQKKKMNVQSTVKSLTPDINSGVSSNNYNLNSGTLNGNSSMSGQVTTQWIGGNISAQPGIIAQPNISIKASSYYTADDTSEKIRALEGEIKFLKGAIILLMDDIGFMRRKIEEISELAEGKIY